MSGSASFSYLLNLILRVFDTLFTTFEYVFDIFTQPLATVLTTFLLSNAFPGQLGTVLAVISKPITDTIFGSFSLIEFMLGAGLGIFVLWTLAKWVLDIL